MCRARKELEIQDGALDRRLIHLKLETVSDGVMGSVFSISVKLSALLKTRPTPDRTQSCSGGRRNGNAHGCNASARGGKERTRVPASREAPRFPGSLTRRWQILRELAFKCLTL